MTVLCNGVSGFDSLQCAIRNSRDRLVLYAFHLLLLDGQDLRQREPVERGARLSEILKPLFAIRYGEHFEGDGAMFFGVAVQHGLEGIVSKRSGEPLTQAARQRLGSRSRTWSRAKFVLLGLERDTGGPPVRSCWA